MQQLELFAIHRSVAAPTEEQHPIALSRLVVPVFGDSDLVAMLRVVIAEGFPHAIRPAAVGRLDVRWNKRLRSTVARVISHPVAPAIEVSPGYHAAHPDELVETLAHEYAHVLHPRHGHGRIWRVELEAALRRLDLPVRRDLVRARHGPPGDGRYVWFCSTCDAAVAVRSRRRRDEVASLSTCCRAAIAVFDVRTNEPAPRRPFEVGCDHCRLRYAAYGDRSVAQRFARTHRCRCGSGLVVHDAA